MPRELTLRPFRVAPKAFHELMIMPMFADVVAPDGSTTQPSPEDGDWTIMDNVTWRVPIIELMGNQNVLKRRDATCRLIYSPVGRTSMRYIFTEEVYAAEEDCVKEFYQGCFIDYARENFQVFFENVMPILEAGFKADIYTNKYFGDISRPADSTGTYSWNKFDGVFTQLNKHILSGLVKEEQTFAITVADGDGIISPTEAHTYLTNAYNAQTFMMKAVSNALKVFYVDRGLYEAYFDWLVAAGQSTIQERQQAAGSIRFKGIEVKPKEWDPILVLLNGGVQAHIVCLTLRSNWLYATDSGYGGGPLLNEAIRVWYSMDLDIWRRQIHAKAGTEWINPQYVVYGATEM